MSRVGNKPVVIPEGVEVQLSDNVLTAKGPKGELSQSFEPAYVEVKIEGNEILVSRKNETKEAKSRHGLYRSLFENIVVGVKTGFSKSLEVRGVGYRVNPKGKALEFNLGYSHSITYDLPEGVEVKFDEQNQNIFTLSGADKQLVGQTAANIRKLRKPEPYKGKGIRYSDEHVIIKAGKSASAA